MKIPPWSHSSLSDFENCNFAYHEKRIAKTVVDPPNEAGQWGDYVHKNFEAYLAHGAALPGNLVQYQDYLDTLAAARGRTLVECKYAIGTDFQPCEWMADNVWCRGIIDLLKIDGDKALALDHKTGKVKSDFNQLKLNALLVFIHHPEVNEVRCGYIWLTHDKITKDTFLRSQESELWQEQVARLRPYVQAHTTGVFRPRQSGLCAGWCPVTHCEYWTPKRPKYGGR